MPARARVEGKRKAERLDESEPEEDIAVEGLLDAEASEDDEEGSDVGGDLASDDEQDEEEEELEKLLEAEEGDDSDESVNDSDFEGFDPNEEVDPRILKDLEDGVRLRSLSAGSHDNEDSKKDFRYRTKEDGTRVLLPEIEPVYDSDDSDREEANTIGNIPVSAYDEMPHIGYDIDGKRIMRPATKGALDALLETIDLPEGWTGLVDKSTGGSLNLSAEELDLIKRLQRGENPDDGFNPYEDTIEYFSGQVMQTPLLATPEPKRRFVPSKHEAKRVMKIVRAIREGRISLKKKDQEQDEQQYYDVWADNAAPQADHVMTLRAPKLPPPTHDESYNPPEEYVPTEEEAKEWENMDPADRERNYLPRKYGALRHVPGYADSVRERFERSLDLYLAPRVRRHKLNIDPDSLIPDLPSPQDLRPFPIKCSTVYRGHSGRVRAVSVDPTGQFVATGGDDGTVRVWELLTGRELWKAAVSSLDAYEERPGAKSVPVDAVAWSPLAAETGVLAVSAGEAIYLVVPPVFHVEIENRGREALEAGYGFATGGKTATADALESDSDDDNAGRPASKQKPAASWTKPSAGLAAAGFGVVIRTASGRTIKHLSWHHRGDYLVSVAPEAANRAVLIHQQSKHATQSPFRKSKGIVQFARFHPFRPHLYVATQRYVRVYDLAAQVLSRKLHPGSRWLSSFDIHPRGDNVLTASYDRRVTWHDLDLSDKPYKTLRYHDKAVRAVGFHRSMPLFCSASDDGNISVFHGSVYDDMMKNPLLVPLKVLRGHEVKSSLGVLAVHWHPREPWLLSAGADGTARLWTT